MMRSGTPLRRDTASKRRRHAAAAPGATAYMRALASKGSAGVEGEALADAETLRLLQHGGAERDIGDAEAAVPEEDRLVLALAPGLPPGDDLAELGMEARLGQLARLDMGAQRPQRPLPALPPIIDHHLV